MIFRYSDPETNRPNQPYSGPMTGSSTPQLIAAAGWAAALAGVVWWFTVPSEEPTPTGCVVLLVTGVIVGVIGSVMRGQEIRRQEEADGITPDDRPRRFGSH